MYGVTCPVTGSTTTMRELLFCAPGDRMAWFESVANSRPPRKPSSNVLVEDQDVGRHRVGR